MGHAPVSSWRLHSRLVFLCLAAAANRKTSLSVLQSQGSQRAFFSKPGVALSVVAMQSLNALKNVTEKCQTWQGMGREENWGWVLPREGFMGRVRGSVVCPMV